VQQLGGDPAIVPVPLQEPGHRDVLREDENRAVLGEDGVEQLVEQFQLAGPAGEAGARWFLEVLRRGGCRSASAP
jgi:hypothetical protein